MSGDDWLYSIENFNGVSEHKLGNNYQFELTAGAGGSGISQIDTGIEYAPVILAYTKIIVENGTINGGSGGNIDMGTEDTPVLTYYGLMNDPVIDRYMQELTNRDTAFDGYVDNATKLTTGRGGDAILIGAGRKYLRVDQNGMVEGGSCGTVDYGRSKLVNCLENTVTDCGDGIGVYGDIGLKNVEPTLNESNMDSKTASSGDVGIYIEGTVKGGSSIPAEAKYENAGNGGNGIYMQGEMEYFETDMSFPQGEDPVKWGIVEVDTSGEVYGGNASQAVFGSGGAGGDGIVEGYTKGEDQSDDSKLGTDYYLIKGKTIGGNGGDSMSSSGSGAGNGLSFANWRKNTVVIGGGDAIGGNSGKGVVRSGLDDIISGGQGVRYYPEDREYLNNTVLLNETNGSASENKVVSNNGLNVAASMTAFSDYPSTSTRLSCTITRPSGYSGDVYVMWFAQTQLQSNTPEVAKIESAGTDMTEFNLLSNAQYKYLAYETHSIPAHDYNVEAATVERIKEILEIQRCSAEIWCEVMLDDGRWAKSNVMRVESGSGWDGSGSGGGESGGGDEQQDQAQIDQAAADLVQALIEDLPSISSITLDDEQAIVDAREAYDALTPAQKELLNPYVYLITDLENAEARIRELKIAAGGLEEITSLINELADPDEILTEEDAQAQDNKLAVIYEMAAQLNDDSMQILAESAEDIARLAAVEKKVAELTGRNHIHLVCHKPARAATCVHDGNIEYYYCLTCNDGTAYIDPDCRLQIEGEVELWSDGESHVLRHVAANPATCLHTGTLEHYRCTECGNLFADAEGTTMYTDESSVIIPVDASKHVWDGGQVTQAATTSQAGIKKYTCTVCGEWRTETIPKLTPTPDPKPSAPAEIIDLPAVKISKPKAAKKKVTVKWKKVSKKNQKKIQGIEVRVVGPGYDQTFPVGKKKTSKTVKGLKSKTKYTVSVRAYKWEGNTKHVSKWKSKKVKIK